MLDPTKTIREHILARIAKLLSDVSTPAYPIAFSTVERGPIRIESPKRLVAGVVAMKEAKLPGGMNFTECRLQISVDFRLRAEGPDSAAVQVEVILGVVQRAVLSDRTLGGLVIDLDEHGNEVDLEDHEDASAEGSVYFLVKYRHNLDDPRVYAP